MTDLHWAAVTAMARVRRPGPGVPLRASLSDARSNYSPEAADSSCATFCEAFRGAFRGAFCGTAL
jgi:hypothetical protein